MDLDIDDLLGLDKEDNNQKEDNEFDFDVLKVVQGQTTTTKNKTIKDDFFYEFDDEDDVFSQYNPSFLPQQTEPKQTNSQIFKLDQNLNNEDISDTTRPQSLNIGTDKNSKTQQIQKYQSMQLEAIKEYPIEQEVLVSQGSIQNIEEEQSSNPFQFYKYQSMQLETINKHPVETVVPIIHQPSLQNIENKQSIRPIQMQKQQNLQFTAIKEYLIDSDTPINTQTDNNKNYQIQEEQTFKPRQITRQQSLSLAAVKEQPFKYENPLAITKEDQSLIFQQSFQKDDAMDFQNIKRFEPQYQSQKMEMNIIERPPQKQVQQKPVVQLQSQDEFQEIQIQENQKYYQQQLDNDQEYTQQQLARLEQQYQANLATLQQQNQQKLEQKTSFYQEQVSSLHLQISSAEMELNELKQNQNQLQNTLQINYQQLLTLTNQNQQNTHQFDQDEYNKLISKKEGDIIILQQQLKHTDAQIQNEQKKLDWIQQEYIKRQEDNRTQLLLQHDKLKKDYERIQELQKLIYIHNQKNQEHQLQQQTQQEEFNKQLQQEQQQAESQQMQLQEKITKNKEFLEAKALLDQQQADQLKVFYANKIEQVEKEKQDVMNEGLKLLKLKQDQEYELEKLIIQSQELSDLVKLQDQEKAKSQQLKQSNQKREISIFQSTQLQLKEFKQQQEKLQALQKQSLELKSSSKSISNEILNLQRTQQQGQRQLKIISGETQDIQFVNTKKVIRHEKQPDKQLEPYETKLEEYNINLSNSQLGLFKNLSDVLVNSLIQ